MQVRLSLDNRDGSQGKKQLQVRLFSPQGELVAEKETVVNYTRQDSLCNVCLDFPLDNLALWTAETPNLYTVRVVQREGGKDEMAFSTKYGFRDIEIRGRAW